MSDVLLFQTNDGGEISVASGVVAMTDELETAVYLSLFGGNDDDEGGSDERLSWWGNIGETDKYRSATQYLIQTLPITTFNLLRVEDAVRGDLEWLTEGNFAKSVDVSVGSTGLNHVDILVTIDGKPFAMQIESEVSQ